MALLEEGDLPGLAAAAAQPKAAIGSHIDGYASATRRPRLWAPSLTPTGRSFQTQRRTGKIAVQIMSGFIWPKVSGLNSFRRL